MLLPPEVGGVLIIILCHKQHEQAAGTKVFYHEDLETDLEFLRGLSPECCSDLTELSVCLHLHGGYPISAKCIPLSQKQIADWQAAAKHVFSNATLGKLKLDLVCDTGEEDSESTSAILQPLLDFAGVLAECELRLHDKKNSRISKYAEEVALRAKGLDASLRRPFPFMQLPTEIRHEILRYTDLVAPSNQVQWSPSEGFHICRWICCIHDECGFCRNGRCSKCQPLGCLTPEYGWRVARVDFCRLVCSGYSPRCRCWTPPRSLMLVNRTIYQEACDVFYTYNRIIVFPIVLNGNHVTHSSSGNNRRPLRLPISQFILRYRQPSILSRLRCLEIVFPPIDPDAYPEEPHPLYSDWSHAIDLLRIHANVANLKINIHIMFRGSDNWRSQYFVNEMKLANNNTESLFKIHKRLLEPLQALQGMKSFYVHLEWPWHWTLKARQAPGRCLGETRPCGFCKSCLVDKIESWLEQTVMGDEYNSHAIGKSKETPRNWLIKEWKTFVFWDLTRVY
ncbi:hypothetical protein F4813DRAFT_379266 [Daldinia decipiens]|uniref:uncharacterized protein n=1 Tax=Daldinia decipiens TaxID=326647 RepID=UPI0020C31B2F|nr:uncharacterized protein F4813DRAFT_379266 [Daldinia decipiens]KAI1660468.1 hypothetical protein F4813DRAFT_379266 [Daldinia decipiens]